MKPTVLHGQLDLRQSKPPEPIGLKAAGGLGPKEPM